MDEIITFNSLTPENFRGIAALMLADLVSILEKKGIEASFTDAARDYVAEKSYSAKYGARNMRRFIQTEIEDKIAGLLVERRGKLDSLVIDAPESGEGVMLRAE